MPEDPSPGVLFAEIRGLVRQVEALTKRLDDLGNTLASTYVPRGEYEADRRGDERRVSDIEKDIAEQAAFRRQVMASLLVGAILLVANLVIAVAGIPGA